MEQPTTPLERAIKHCGSIAELARRIDRSPQLVGYWRNAVKGVPAEEAPRIEAAVDGAVTRQELCPNVFGSPTTQPAQEGQAA